MPAEKICVICGNDCSTRPRLKDSQGQYACQACVEAKQRPRPKPAASTPAPTPTKTKSEPAIASGGLGFSMDDYLGDVQTAEADPASHCPSCGAAKAAGAVVCMQCGYDSTSGKAISTKVRKAKVQKARRGPRLSGGPVYILIAVSMLVALPVLALISIEAAAIGAIVAFLWYAISYAYMVGAAFRDDDRFWGFLGVLFWLPLAGQFCWLAFVLYYCTIGSHRGVRKLNFWASFATLWIIVGVMYLHSAEMAAAEAAASAP